MVVPLYLPWKIRSNAKNYLRYVKLRLLCGNNNKNKIFVIKCISKGNVERNSAIATVDSCSFLQRA